MFKQYPRSFLTLSIYKQQDFSSAILQTEPEIKTSKLNTPAKHGLL